MNEGWRHSTTALPIHTSTYPPTPTPLHSLYSVLMTLYVDKLHRENRKDRRRRKETLLFLLPSFHPPSSFHPSSPSSALQRRPLSVAIVTVGLCTFFLLLSGSLLDLSLTPSSPYDWAVPFPEQSRATFKEPPHLSSCFYCLCEQHMVAVLKVSHLVC